MAFSEILGQTSALDALKKTIHHQRLPSAYLFAGPHNTGKCKTILALAQVLNCEKGGEDACLQCDVCLQVAHGTFPDFSLVQPDGQFVKIDQIKEALKWLHLRSASGNHRILGIIEAERMNKESANAFLKMLEEPPPQTLIILLAEHPHQLLETLVSRCQLIRFQPLKKAHVQHIMQGYSELTPAHIEFLSQFSLGRVRPDWIEKVELLQTMRDWVIQNLTKLSPQTLHAVFQEMEKWSSSKTGDWGYMLDFLEYWLRDLQWLASHLPQAELFNQDRLPQLQTCLQQIQPSQVQAAYEQVLETRERIQMNANPALALETLWIYFKNHLKPASP